MEGNVVKLPTTYRYLRGGMFLSQTGMQKTWKVKCTPEFSSLVIQVGSSSTEGGGVVCGHSDGQSVDSSPHFYFPRVLGIAGDKT